VTWYQLYKFLLGRGDADITDLNYKKEWDILFNNQIISGNYSKTPFLMRSASLLTEIITMASTLQKLLFWRYKCKPTRSVNTENAVRQATRTNASEGKDHNFFHIVNSNPNPEIRILLNRNLIIWKWSSSHIDFFSKFIYSLYFEYYIYITLLFKYYNVIIGQIIFIFFSNWLFLSKK